MFRILIGLFTAAALLFATPARAWWEYGHYTVADIAYLQVRPTTDLDDALERAVADLLRIAEIGRPADAPERAGERRDERLGGAARWREEVHERIRSPDGSKKAPCVMRAPRRSRSTWTSTRVPGSDRFVGTHASPIT